MIGSRERMPAGACVALHSFSGPLRLSHPLVVFSPQAPPHAHDPQQSGTAASGTAVCCTGMPHPLPVSGMSPPALPASRPDDDGHHHPHLILTHLPGCSLLTPARFHHSAPLPCLFELRADALSSSPARFPPSGCWRARPSGFRDGRGAAAPEQHPGAGPPVNACRALQPHESRAGSCRGSFRSLSGKRRRQGGCLSPAEVGKRA